MAETGEKNSLGVLKRTAEKKKFETGKRDEHADDERTDVTHGRTSRTECAAPVAAAPFYKGRSGGRKTSAAAAAAAATVRRRRRRGGWLLTDGASTGSPPRMRTYLRAVRRVWTTGYTHAAPRFRTRAAAENNSVSSPSCRTTFFVTPIFKVSDIYSTLTLHSFCEQGWC